MSDGQPLEIQFSVRLKASEVEAFEKTLRRAKCSLDGDGIKNYVLHGMAGWGTAETTGEKFAQLVTDYIKEHPEHAAMIRAQAVNLAGAAVKSLFTKFKKTP